MDPINKELINEKFTGVYARIDANQTLLEKQMQLNHDSIHDQLKLLIDLQKETRDQAKLTNGRVTKLEIETAIVKWLNKKIVKIPLAIGIIISLIKTIYDSIN